MKATTLRNMKSGRPRTTAFKMARKVAANYYVNTKTGHIYNKDGKLVGSNTYEPRISVRLDGKKYNLRQNKAVGLVVFGTEALRRGVSVKHKNGVKADNRKVNLELVYSPKAARAYRRLQNS